MNAPHAEFSLNGRPVTLRELTASDAASVVSLHRRVFGSVANEEWYRWKYATGRAEAVGLWAGDELVAHCAGIARDFLHAGELAHDLQIGDVMVAPEWRGLFLRKGAFFQVSQALYASRLGIGRRFASGFGFPSDRHMQLALKTGLLMDAGGVLDVQWDVPANTTLQKPVLSRWLWRVTQLSAGHAAWASTVDACWSRMTTQAAQFSIGERSSAYCRWRFVSRPDHSCIFLVLRRPWTNQATGVAVVSAPTAGQPRAQWLDWIGSLSHMHEARAMCQDAARRLWAAGLTAWMSEGVLALADAQAGSTQQVAARIGVPVASAVNQADLNHRKWWLMGGDTDFL